MSWGLLKHTKSRGTHNSRICLCPGSLTHTPSHDDPTVQGQWNQAVSVFAALHILATFPPASIPAPYPPQLGITPTHSTARQDLNQQRVPPALGTWGLAADICSVLGKPRFLGRPSGLQKFGECCIAQGTLLKTL